MDEVVTDEQVQELAATARPFAVALLHWTSRRVQPGAEVTERAHQRRMVGLRAAGTIAVLCPVSSDTLAGVVLMNVPPEEAAPLLDDDPCVLAGMMRHEVHLCHGFPGDALPGGAP